MKKSSALLVERAIQVEELPAVVPRPLAAKFGFVTTRTLKNHEGRGLTPIKRNTRSVGYLKQELLQFFGIADEPAKSASFPQRRQRAKA